MIVRIDCNTSRQYKQTEYPSPPLHMLQLLRQQVSPFLLLHLAFEFHRLCRRNLDTKFMRADFT